MKLICAMLLFSYPYYHPLSCETSITNGDITFTTGWPTHELLFLILLILLDDWLLLKHKGAII